MEFCADDCRTWPQDLADYLLDSDPASQLTTAGLWASVARCPLPPLRHVDRIVVSTKLRAMELLETRIGVFEAKRLIYACVVTWRLQDLAGYLLDSDPASLLTTTGLWASVARCPLVTPSSHGPSLLWISKDQLAKGHCLITCLGRTQSQNTSARLSPSHHQYYHLYMSFVSLLCSCPDRSGVEWDWAPAARVNHLR